MKKIAILRCLNKAESCTGSGCLKSMREKSKAFSPYAGEETELCAFFTCNGCARDPETDEALLKKLDRLQKMGIDVLHTAGCTAKGEAGAWCENVAKIACLARARGIAVVHGTHK